MTVIASVKLDYVRATGGGARESERGEAGLRARADEPDFLRAFDRRREQFRELDLEPRRRAEAKTESCLLGNRPNDARMSMAEDCGAVGADVIEKSVAVGIDQSSAAATFDEDWRTADGLPCADGRIDRTRNLNTGAVEKFIRFFA